ncbi:hypothetical protein F5Y16DRAFT_239952 [Xylariaceae sp. FL0255]|nr:hypothetical protein F5Y16DRAFT_239952 [Xylariaceae sp. FL0255]
MATSQYGALTPLQHFNQHQHQHPPQPHPHQHPHPHPHYNQLAFQQIQQPPPPQLQPTAHAPNGSIHPHLQQQQQQHPPPQPQPQPQPQPPPPQQQPMTLIPTTVNPNNPSNLNLHVDPAISNITENPITEERRKAGRPAKRRRQDKDAAAELPASPANNPRQPTAHPFSKGPYNTLEDAIFSLQLHVFTSGYGVSQKRTVKEKLPSGKYDPEGDIIRKDFACDKGGNEFVSQSRGERRRESKKCGCPWKAAIRRLRREGDRWFIEILENNHNHPVTEPDEMHTLASYRRWQRENNAGIRSAISRLTRAAAMPARQIAAYLKGDVQDPELDRIDKQILRALSMNDKELPGSEKDNGSVVFEMLARRPVIILQDNEATTSTVNGQPSNPNPSPPTPAPAAVGNLPNTMTPGTTAFGNGPSAAYHHTFATAFTNPSTTTHPTPNPTTMTMSTGDSTSGGAANNPHPDFSEPV